MDDKMLASIIEQLQKASPQHPIYTRSPVAAAEAIATLDETASNATPQLIRLIETSVEFGYGSALEDTRNRYTEGYGYTFREV